MKLSKRSGMKPSTRSGMKPSTRSGRKPSKRSGMKLSTQIGMTLKTGSSTCRLHRSNKAEIPKLRARFAPRRRQMIVSYRIVYMCRNGSRGWQYRIVFSDRIIGSAYIVIYHRIHFCDCSFSSSFLTVISHNFFQSFVWVNCFESYMNYVQIVLTHGTTSYMLQ